jgi:hypothetical protein
MSSTLAVTNTITGGNLSTGGTLGVTGAITGSSTASITGTVTGGNLSTGGTLSVTGTSTLTGAVTASSTIAATGNITGGNLVTTGTANVGTLRTTTITAGASGTAGTITGTWTLGSGSKMQATYADLAEYYSAEEDIEVGTVVELGGTKDIRVCDTPNSFRVAGIVSTDPAYLMNAELDSVDTRVAVALVGRVPCRVVGKCQKGDLLVSAGNGSAMVNNQPAPGTIIGKSLANKDTDGLEVIEVMVGKH